MKKWTIVAYPEEGLPRREATVVAATHELADTRKDEIGNIADIDPIERRGTGDIRINRQQKAAPA